MWNKNKWKLITEKNKKMKWEGIIAPEMGWTVWWYRWNWMEWKRIVSLMTIKVADWWWIVWSKWVHENAKIDRKLINLRIVQEILFMTWDDLQHLKNWVSRSPYFSTYYFWALEFILQNCTFWRPYIEIGTQTNTLLTSLTKYAGKKTFQECQNLQIQWKKKHCYANIKKKKT